MKKKKRNILSFGKMLHIIDSYAWIEYFIGSAKGEVLKKLFLDYKNRFLIVECCAVNKNALNRIQGLVRCTELLLLGEVHSGIRKPGVRKRMETPGNSQVPSWLPAIRRSR